MFIDGLKGELQGLRGTSLEDTPKDSTGLYSVVDSYRSVYQKLPYPMYLIDSALKYELIIKCMQAMNSSGEPYRYLLQGGIRIQLSDNKDLHLYNADWVIEPTLEDAVYTEAEVTPKLGGIEANKYGTEYEWLYGQLIKGNSVNGFYKKFCPEVLKACHTKGELQDTLSSLMDCTGLTDNLHLSENTIHNPDTGVDSMLYIYTTDTTQSREYSYYLNTETGGIDSKRQQTPHYAPVVYTRLINNKGYCGVGYISKPMELKKHQGGLTVLFRELMYHIKQAGSLSNVKYSGVVLGNTLYFDINGELYSTPYTEYTPDNVKRYSLKGRFIGYTGNEVYFAEKDGGLELVYSISRATGDTELKGCVGC